MKNKELIIKGITIIFFLLITLTIAIYLYQLSHESIHKEIFRYYGIKSEIKIGFIKSYTEPESNCIKDTCNLAQNLTEVLGYTLFPFYMFFIVGITIKIIKEIF